MATEEEKHLINKIEIATEIFSNFAFLRNIFLLNVVLTAVGFYIANIVHGNNIFAAFGAANLVVGLAIFVFGGKIIPIMLTRYRTYNLPIDELETLEG
jgi:hypothetical protein